MFFPQHISQHFSVSFHILLVVSAPEDGHCTSDTSHGELCPAGHAPRDAGTARPISSADAGVTGEISEASAHAQQSGQGVTWVLKTWDVGNLW